jgi:hypothetical protein
MPINALQKNSPRGRGPEPSETLQKDLEGKQGGEESLKEADLAAQEIQDLWESQETGITGWSGEAGNRYSDPQ